MKSIDCYGMFWMFHLYAMSLKVCIPYGAGLQRAGKVTEKLDTYYNSIQSAHWADWANWAGNMDVKFFFFLQPLWQCAYIVAERSLSRRIWNTDKKKAFLVMGVNSAFVSTYHTGSWSLTADLLSSITRHDAATSDLKLVVSRSIYSLVLWLSMGGACSILIRKSDLKQKHSWWWGQNTCNNRC